MTAFKLIHGPVAREGSEKGDCFDRLRDSVAERIARFRGGEITPMAAYEFERDLKVLVEEMARAILQEEFQKLEPAGKSEASPRVGYHKQTYRINKRTPATIDTLFGPMVLWSYLYLNEEAGEPGLHPLHVQLGISHKTTAVLAERVGRWAVDYSQREVRRLVASEHGVHWSNDRLRAVLREFRRWVNGFRHEVQLERVLRWLKQASRSKGRYRPVLSVGRDGVMIPIRGAGYKEASTATVSVYDRRRRRLGTVYLGQMPEPLQTTLSRQLTDLLKAILRGWNGSMPRLAYVTDKGKTQDNYWRTLKRMRHPCRPEQKLPWEWVLDFFHVCGYVSKVREALFGTSNTGYRWFRRMRSWLRDRRQGVANILRSAMQHCNRRKLTRSAIKEFGKAYRYLRRYSQWMDYERYRREGLPIGSGVTEAACKTLFTQRLKRSGMRWNKKSGQIIVDLRVLHLSGIWEEVVLRDLQTRPRIERLEKRSHRPQQLKKFEKAA